MLSEFPNSRGISRNLRRERRLWQDGLRHTRSLGCTVCPDRSVCGELQIGRKFFDCLGLCCGKPSDCDTVCRNRPDVFVAGPSLPSLVPVLYHSGGRLAPFKPPAVCLPLYKVIQRQNGAVRYARATDLARGFAIAADVPVILTGTAPDRPLERWWSLGSERREAIRALRRLGVALVTTPNYSLFTDQPRWDDLHSIKRIAITHEEFLSEGLPAALHVNARTEKDWERWTDYVAGRPEVTHLAFEFSTGAGYVDRIQWHRDQLIKLAGAVERPLHLIMRGGAKLLYHLAVAFPNITLLETSLFMKTKSRQRAVLFGPGKVAWESSPTETSETIDTLLAENWNVITASYAGLLERKQFR